MALPGSDYLYALGAVSITFVGFSALLLVFGQAAGRPMTGFAAHFMLSFIQSGFIVAAGSFLLQLLAWYDLPETTVWRASSVVMAVAVLGYAVALPRRRRAVSPGSLPVYVRTLLGVQVLIGGYLIADSLDALAGSEGAPYAACLTGFLATTGAAYLQALGRALQGPSEPKP